MVSNNYIKHITCCAAVHVTDEHMFWSYAYVLEVMDISLYIMHGYERSPAEVLGAQSSAVSLTLHLQLEASAYSNTTIVIQQ